MALVGEDLSYDDLKDIVEGLTCRNTAPNITPELPRGTFDLASFPEDDVDTSSAFLRYHS